MKKLFFLLITGMMSVVSFAQDSMTPQKPGQYAYCQLSGTAKLFSSKIKVEIDFGQETDFWSFRNRRMVDENNNPIIFNSMIDAMNYMGQDGWEFVQAYVVVMNEDINVYHWLLKKNISHLSSDEKELLFSGLKLKE